MSNFSWRDCVSIRYVEAVLRQLCGCSKVFESEYTRCEIRNIVIQEGLLLSVDANSSVINSVFEHEDVKIV